jgi:hypothetical protein
MRHWACHLTAPQLHARPQRGSESARTDDSGGRTPSKNVGRAARPNLRTSLWISTVMDAHESMGDVCRDSQVPYSPVTALSTCAGD